MYKSIDRFFVVATLKAAVPLHWNLNFIYCKIEYIYKCIASGTGLRRAIFNDYFKNETRLSQLFIVNEKRPILVISY